MMATPSVQARCTNFSYIPPPPDFAAVFAVSAGTIQKPQCQDSTLPYLTQGPLLVRPRIYILNHNNGHAVVQARCTSFSHIPPPLYFAAVFTVCTGTIHKPQGQGSTLPHLTQGPLLVRPRI